MGKIGEERLDAGFHSLGKLLILVGFVFVLAGGLLLLLGKVPHLGRLPGDILIQRMNWNLYFPLGTGILLSIILSILLTLLISFLGRR
jgi:hypothetical protein